MTQSGDIRSRRLELAGAAARRWQERAPQREEHLKKLAEGGPAAADSADRVRNNESMRARRPRGPAGIAMERLIGPRNNLLKTAPDTRALAAGRPVARIVLRGGFGTGFMVSPRLLMTNHHVLTSDADADGATANFDYEYVKGGISNGVHFELDPATFFHNDEVLDFALVAVKPMSFDGAPLAGYGWHRLNPVSGKAIIGQPVSIIQHPNGEPKQYAVEDNLLSDVFDQFLHYTTDTLPGSSGSPSFGAGWEVAALHHSGVPKMRGDQYLDRQGNVWTRDRSDDDIDWIANEGVRISQICAHLDQVAGADPAKAVFIAGLKAAPPAAAATESAPQAVSLPAPVAAPPQVAAGSAYVNVFGNAVITINPVAAAAPLAAPPRATESVSAQEKVLSFDRDYARRRGYDERFLWNFEIPLPAVSEARSRELLRGRGGEPVILDYHHFSVCMNARRKMQMWSAANVSYDPATRDDRGRADFGTDKWILDPRIPADVQLSEKEFYKPARKFDVGHIVRRDDNAWGATAAEIEAGNSDTFHLTNATPQHESYNRSNKQGVWGRLENHIAQQSEAAQPQMSLFAGPVLDNRNDLIHDFGGGPVQVPLSFWKVVATVETDSGTPVLSAYGFLLDQAEVIKVSGLEKFDAGEFETFQVPLAHISELTGVNFPDVLDKADVMRDQQVTRASRELLKDLSSLKFRRRSRKPG